MFFFLFFNYNFLSINFNVFSYLFLYNFLLINFYVFLHVICFFL